MRQLSIWSLATESRTSLRSSSFCFRESTSWSLVRRIRPDRKSENTCKCFESRTMPLNPDQFAKIAESLRQYRRAEMAQELNSLLRAVLFKTYSGVTRRRYRTRVQVVPDHQDRHSNRFPDRFGDDPNAIACMPDNVKTMVSLAMGRQPLAGIKNKIGKSWLLPGFPPSLRRLAFSRWMLCVGPS